MKLLAVVTGLVLLTGFANAKTDLQVIENAKKFTVIVTNEGLLGGGRGTGILLNEHTILTCMHMGRTYDDEFFVYTYPFGKVYKAHIDRIDPANDIAFLVVEDTMPVRVRPVFQTVVTDGEPITVIGNTLGGMKWMVSKGVISGRERKYLLTDAAGVHPGNSGGPWINAKGEIVGMTDWGLRDVPGVTGGISGATLATQVDYYLHPEKLWAKFLEALFGKPKAKAKK